MTRRRRQLGVAAASAAALTLLLAGCSGGGGGGDSADAASDQTGVTSSMPVATGAGPAESAALAIASLGTPGAVATDESGASLTGFDSFGTPDDPFEQKIKPDPSGTGSSGSQAPALPGDTPITDDPIVALPGGSGTVTDPNAGVPVQNPLALEADFDVSGEPVVAREGDAIPPDTQQFTVERVLKGQVVLKLSGGLLPDGTDTVTLDEGESITLYNATAKRSYRIKLVDVRAV